MDFGREGGRDRWQEGGRAMMERGRREGGGREGNDGEREGGRRDRRRWKEGGVEEEEEAGS